MIYKYKTSNIQDPLGLNIHRFVQVNDKKKSHPINSRSCHRKIPYTSINLNIFRLSM